MEGTRIESEMMMNT